MHHRRRLVGLEVAASWRASWSLPSPCWRWRRASWRASPIPRPARAFTTRIAATARRHSSQHDNHRRPQFARRPASRSRRLRALSMPMRCWWAPAPYPTPRSRQPAGLAIDNGLIVDEHCRTSDPADLRSGRRDAFSRGPDGPVRLENWRHAQDHGAVAGRNAAGANDAYRPVPSFSIRNNTINICRASAGPRHSRVPISAGPGR